MAGVGPMVGLGIGPMVGPVGRRRLLAGAGATLGLAALGGCAGRSAGGQNPNVPEAERLVLETLRVGPERITRITVCTRPFRPQGPRIERVRLGDRDVIHHYGHGGSGWSLSWGSGAMATELALGTGAREIAVIGCGAIGLTTAVLLARSGAAVTIYASELPPEVPSAWASGVWSPDSRICLEEHATPAFKAQWAAMTRRSHAMFQGLLGLPGEPVEWIDSYYVRPAESPPPPPDPRPRFARLRRELVPDLSVGTREYAPGSHPFGDLLVRRFGQMVYNLGAYFRLLMADYLQLGGRLEVRTFHGVQEVLALRQRTIVNCTGYGARALFGDDTLVPVRGQLTRTMTQPGIHYGLFYNELSFVPRRDGFVFQRVGPDDYYGYGDDTTVPDRAEAEAAVRGITVLFDRA